MTCSLHGRTLGEECPKEAYWGPQYLIFIKDLFYFIKQAKLNAFSDDHQIYYSRRGSVVLEECLCKEVETKQ